MIEGRIVAGDRDLGSGFSFTDRMVATAAHVVRDQDSAALAFVASSGIRTPVEKVEPDPRIDAAILWVAESLAVVPRLAYPSVGADWRVTARPESAAVQLTGRISAVDHLVTNSAGHEMTVLQLHVEQDVREFRGYSGSAVVVDGAVVGILVEQVLERAAPSPALRRLATNVLYAVPLEQVVRRFRLAFPIPRQVGSLPVHQLLDTAYFDLDRLKTAILNAKSETVDRLLVFGIECTELKVIANLCTWLPTYVGEVAQKTHLTLRPDLTSVDGAVRSVTRYSADLHRGINVVCPVLVDGVQTEQVADFCERVRPVCDGHAPRLVLFLAGSPAGGYPPGVIVLPRPSFAHRDVESWARQVVASRRWPTRVAVRWGRHISEEASAGDQLDIRWTYEALEGFIQRIRLEPDDLLRFIEDLGPRC